jgi:hypothetical protein
MEREQKQLANMMTNDKRHDLLSVNIHSTHLFTKKTLLAQGVHFYSAPHPKRDTPEEGLQEVRRDSCQWLMNDEA